MECAGNIRISRGCNKLGMTLIEVMFAITLFAFGMLSINLMYMQGFRMFDASRNITQVSQILQNQMESLRSVSLSSIQAQVGTTVYSASDLSLPNIHAKTGAPFGWESFALTQNITTISTDYYDVTLTANWVNRYSIPGQVIFTTQIAKGGLNEYFTRTQP